MCNAIYAKLIVLFKQDMSKSGRVADSTFKICMLVRTTLSARDLLLVLVLVIMLSSASVHLFINGGVFEQEHMLVLFHMYQ